MKKDIALESQVNDEAAEVVLLIDLLGGKNIMSEVSEQPVCLSWKEINKKSTSTEAINCQNSQ